MLQKTKVGLLLIGSQRFKKLGAGCPSGDYETRKKKFTENFIAGILDIALPIFKSIVYTREEVDDAIGFFHSENVDCIICVFLSWCEDRTWISFLRNVYNVPLLFYIPSETTPAYSDTRDEDDFIEFLAKGGLVGSLEASGSIARFGKNIEIVSDNFDSAHKRIDTFVRAARTTASLRNTSFGLLGHYNELMWSTYIDPYDMFAKIGPELKFISYCSLKEAIDAIDDATTEKYTDELASLYYVEPDVERNFFVESARASLALASLRDEYNLGALMLNDISHELFRIVGLRPGFYHPSFNEKNAILAPEGDLGAGTITYVLKQLSGQHVNFIEPFYLAKATNTFSAGHAGPHDYTDPRYRGNVRISRDTRFAKTSYKYAGAPFAWYRIPQGRKTIAHFSECNGCFKIICFTAESLPGEHSLCSYSHSDFRPDTEVTKLFEDIIKIGATQHFACVDGDCTEDLAVFARMNKFEFYRF